ncbi:ubiquitin carboxyl-terminal hydrolase FAM188A isoform X2 [Phalaenopsis equestris]|uniref:ubiquitin carboxyl-terminal hydrolase FAM188A isoform X2 n=1 Tax=Phalaenopsis equestris TaxID=78828 RepID=UPI0009E5C07F|nr:ubiquitin carboxyl-terminal hydrolase FAM188A isoform X2 [Phalaenopsis equestris]
MADREEEELQMALRMSLQGSPPEAKRSKPRESAEESVEAKNRRLQRELLASAAEKRMKAAENKRVVPTRPVSAIGEAAEKGLVASARSSVSREEVASGLPDGRIEGSGRAELDTRVELSPVETDGLFSMVFGIGVSKNILAQWCNQGISSDPETCIGLVQHEGGPCGVLATIQAFVLKYLLFFPDDLNKFQDDSPLQSLDLTKFCQSSSSPLNDFTSITEDRKARSLVLGMLEILFLCGNMKRAVVATLSFSSRQSGEGSEDGQNNETMNSYLEGLSIESASDLQKVLRIKTYTAHNVAFQDIMSELPIFQSRMGALLFLISALLSRGLESIQADRDDPSLPLVTAPFGHASQEIVNLLLCGQAVPNVFDGRMDLGGGMFLMGISTSVEVGFLTLLESLNFCKVGRHLKCPRWPIWVVGSESHYTVLFALDPSVQDENELEERESRIHRIFDAQDQSGGGGFISIEGFQQVLRECNINFPPAKLESLCFSGFIVWSEFLQELLELDRSLGGLKDSSGSMGKKLFDLYHFNGIAKSVLNGNVGMVGESPLQRPRLCKLSVSVPPRWTQEEFLSDRCDDRKNEVGQAAELTQHAPLVDCIRTRWPRAVCSWIGDAPSIV